MATRCNPQWPTKHLARLSDQFGLPKVGVHGLRHTATALMLNSGVPIHTVASRLGHNDLMSSCFAASAIVAADDADRVIDHVAAGGTAAPTRLGYLQAFKSFHSFLAGRRAVVVPDVLRGGVD